MMTMDKALQLLGLDEDATAEQVKARYRERAMELHPDRGGTPEQMAQLNAAWEVAKNKPPPVCSTCRGAGSIERTSMLSSIRISCPTCSVTKGK